MGARHETLRYTFRLRPGTLARRALSDEWHRCRFLWNEAVQQQRAGRRPTSARLSKMLTEARSRSAWLRAGSQVAQQQVLRNYAEALDHSFKVRGRGRPKSKRRKTALPTLAYSARGFRIRDGRLRLAGNVVVPVVWSRALPSAPTSVRVFQDSLGHWYASFVVRREVEPTPPVEGRIGIDWGISTTATATDPAYDLPYAGHRRKCQLAVKRAQRRTARRHRPGPAQSRGHQRARQQTARLQKRAQRQNDFTSRAWAKSVVANHQLVAVEDLRTQFLRRTRLARKAADAAIGTAKRELISWGRRAAREVVLVPPAYTTMTCGSCGARAKHQLPLAERTFRCDSCGHVADRDRNAARAILAAAERNRLGVDDVRHPTVSQEVVEVQSEPGIPSRESAGRR